MNKLHTLKYSRLIYSVIAALVLFPIFIQWSSGVYRSVPLLNDSGGMLGNLPLPISIGACFLGMFLLRKNYKQATIAAIYTVTFCATLLISMFLVADNFNIEQRKMMLAAQFLLPTIGLVVGQLVSDQDNVVPRVFMWVLWAVVPLQLLSSWGQHTLTLTHYLYVFSVYQHLQYVPVIFVTAFCYVMVRLWQQNMRVLLLFAVIMCIYVVASGSFLAIGLYVSFLTLFFGGKLLQRKTGYLIGLVIFLISLVAAVSLASIYLGFARTNTSIIGDNGNYLGKFETLAQGKLPVNVEVRLADWKMYQISITESTKTLLLGHTQPPAREIKTSAHNWYLDVAYNFGVISLIPILGLILFTTYLIWRNRKILMSDTWWLLGFVAFLVLIDSNFKVTLRQPYSGIFTFLLWGLLLKQLMFNTKMNSESA